MASSLVIAVNREELTGGYYDETITKLRAKLADSYIHGKTYNRPILPVFGTTTGDARWFDIKLLVKEANSATVTLRFRKEDLYLQGYQVNSQRWRELKEEGKGPQIPGSELLRFGGSYSELRAYATLGTVGRDPLLQAAIKLATSTVDAEVARSLFVMIVMFSEAARFVPVQLFVQREFFNSAHVPDWIDGLVHRWGALCGHVLYFDAHPKEPFVQQTLRIDVNGVVKNVVVISVSDALLYLGILMKNPSKIQPSPPN